MSNVTRRAETTVVGDVWSLVRRKSRMLRPFLLIIVLWELVAFVELVPSQYFPQLYVVAQTLLEMTLTGELLVEAWATVRKVLLAFAMGVTTGTVLGLLMGRSRLVRWFFDPIVSISFPFPKITLMPMFILWFGTGWRPQILLGAFACTFPVIISTYAGTRGIPKERIWAARSMGASELRIYQKVIFPSTLPSIFNGVQIALPISFIIIILTEMLSGTDGLGDLLIYSARFFQTPEQYATIITIAIIGLVLDRSIRVVRANALAWAE